jgi:hypothetical protein
VNFFGLWLGEGSEIMSILNGSNCGSRRVAILLLASSIGIALIGVDDAGAGQPIPLSVVVSGSPQAIQSAVASGADPNARYENGATATHIAAAGPSSKALATLLSLGGEVSPVDRAKATPLHLAVYYNRPGNAILLIKRGAKLNAQDGLGQSPVHVAIERNNPGALGMLIWAGASLQVRDARGRNPLVMAATNLEPKLTRLLIDAGARLDNPRVLPGIAELVEEMKVEGAPSEVLRDAAEVHAMLKEATKSAPAARR